MYRKLIAVVVAVAVFTGCETITKEESGGLAGAAAGGVLGSTIGRGQGQALAIIAGALLGAYVGSSVGKSLDRQDEINAQHAMEHNRSGERTVWVNPDTRSEVTVTPTSTYQTASGQYCREYQTTVTVGGKVEQAYGTACRQPDGTWKLMQQ